jgi:hypothetical protein
MLLREIAYDATIPLRGPPLWLVAVVVLLGGLAAQAGVFGMPLGVILLGWVWAYAYLLLEATAEGLPAPVLSIERTNPWHEPRAFAPLLALFVAGWASNQVGSWGHTLSVAIFGVGLALLPACLALLATGVGMARAFSLPALLTVVAGLGLRYGVLLGLGLLYALVVTRLSTFLPAWVCGGVALLALYSFTAALGGALYRRRARLGFDALAAPEKAEDRAAAAAGRQADKVAEEIYALLRVRRDDEAWAVASRWLGAAPTDPLPCQWLRDRALLWSEARFADRLDDLLVSRLVARGRLGEAIAAIEANWRRGGRLARRPAAERAALEAAAARMGHVETVERLQRDAVQDERA